LQSIYLDARTIRKTSYETRKLEHGEQIRESPIHRPTPEDVRTCDPTTRALDQTVKGEDRAKAERWKRRFEGLKGIAALLAALRELLDSISNPRRRGPPPETQLDGL